MQALGLTAGEVTFAGHLPSRDDVRAAVRDADIGLIPHRANEAWNTTIPNKLFDYMAAELPVITSDAVPFARIVQETGAGVVFKSRDPESLAAAIRTLFDGGLRRAYGAAGLAAVQSRYNWEYDSRALLDALRRAVRDPVARTGELAPVQGIS
jgi:glycosyltransferase involved in cell wall biosynthesis